VEAALAREIEEETGLTGIKTVQHLGIYLSSMRIRFESEGNAGLLMSVYDCEIPADAAITLSDEHTELGWLSPAESAKLLQFKFPKEFCDVLKGL